MRAIITNPYDHFVMSLAGVEQGNAPLMTTDKAEALRMAEFEAQAAASLITAQGLVVSVVREDGEKDLFAALDEAHELNSFLWFELGYTRPTDWMVHIWDKRGGGDKKIVCTQETNRSDACGIAAAKLRTYCAAHFAKTPNP